MQKPIVAITMGDAAGIGPEITAKALAEPELRTWCVPLVLGDLGVMRDAAAAAGRDLRFTVVRSPAECPAGGDEIAFLDYANVDRSRLQMGVMDPALGEAAVHYTRRAARLAMADEIQAIVSAPLNKEAMRAAGHHYEGATAIFAEEAGVKRHAMILILGEMRLMLLTNHMSLRDAIDHVTKERVYEKIMLAHEALLAQGMTKPKIGVSALNPHAGEGGLFGREEIEQIEPAIARARAEGVDAIGPVPPDTVFFKTKQGLYDLTLALYHDAGLGAVKLLGFGTVVTLLAGLPFIRTSTGHGTAFDIAGKGIADHKNLLGAIQVAADLGARRLTGGDRARRAAGR
jgi:4-hydroxythreonine-4-phosphate dehydrogenase